MSEDITMVPALTIGLDIGDRKCVGCAVDAAGDVVATFQVATSAPALSKRLAGISH